MTFRNNKKRVREDGEDERRALERLIKWQWLVPFLV